LQDTGSYVVRVGLRSTGECHHHATGKETFPLRVVRSNAGNTLYACWSGNVTSDVVKFDVVEPRSAVDRAALEYVRSPDFPVTAYMADAIQHRLAAGIAAMLERFPTSHYTYVPGCTAAREHPSASRSSLGCNQPIP
jgi:hypothetical protein